MLKRWGAVVLWIPMALIKLVGIAAGLILVPLALVSRHMSLHASDPDHWPEVLWLWHNAEEQCPDWWLEREHPWYIKPWPQFWWYAIRNPFNNFRFLFTDVPLRECEVRTNWSTEAPMEAHNMKQAKREMAYRWVRYGSKAGYRRVWLNGDGRYSEIWMGWKLGSLVPGLGFTMQARFRRKIGT